MVGRSVVVGTSMIFASMLAIFACTSTVVGTGNPTPGGTSGNTSSGTGGTTSGAATSTSGSSAACVNITGTWSVSGTCGPDTCDIEQTDCSITLHCGTSTLSGNLDGHRISYSGLNSDLGYVTNCSGTISASEQTAIGICDPDKPDATRRCSFSASKQ